MASSSRSSGGGGSSRSSGGGGINKDYVCSVCTYCNDESTTDISCIICNEILPYYTKINGNNDIKGSNDNINHDGDDRRLLRKRKIGSDSLARLDQNMTSTTIDNNNNNSTTTIICLTCTYGNEIDSTLDIERIDCEMCGKSISVVSMTTTKDKGVPLKENRSPDSIICINCTFENSVNSIACVMCFEPLPNKKRHNTTSSSSSSSSKSDQGILKYFGTSANRQEYSEEALTASIAFNSESATDGIIQLLERALRKTGTSFRLCSPLTHISQTGVEIGAKWSCGYRNIQMLCTALMQVPACKARLFKGDGDIPDVYGMQRWIERAWEDGFDELGRDQLGGSLLGTDIWIGATECAALLRYFGLKAEIVDFSIYQGDSSKQLGDRLISWIKTYFEYCKKNGGLIFPLYFQHDGHSRTIVGYEETQVKTNILIFDPCSNGKTMKQKLINYTNNEPAAGWQVMMKRGLHTMVNKEYQIVFIDARNGDGIMSPQLRHQSKILEGISDRNSKIALNNY